MENVPASDWKPDSGDADNDLGSEDAQTDFQRAVKEHLAVECDNDELSTMIISAMLESEEILAEVLKSQKEIHFEIVCRMKPPEHKDMQIQIDLFLDVFICYGIDLNDRNKNGKTLLMLACRKKRVDVVCSLVKMASHGFVISIEAVDNSGETALIKTKLSSDTEIVAALLVLELIYVLEDKNEDIIIWRTVLDEFNHASDILLKSWDFNQEHQYMKAREYRQREEQHKFEIWRCAMFIAMEKDTKRSEEILELLLDDEIILSIEVEFGCPILLPLVGLCFKEKVDNDKKLRLIEILLESGKVNVNSINENGTTARHLAREEKLISLLICYGADVNKKNNEGKTPLIYMDMSGLKVEVLQSILLNETGTLVDMNAMECDGKMALMDAVKWGNPDVVILLLNAGASVNLSDHLGFTALHHALHVNIRGHVEFPRNSDELKKRIKMAILFDAEKPLERYWNAKRMEIVEMLLQRSDIDVNALSFEKFTPLDIAEGVIPLIPSSIKDALKEKGAVLNVFRQRESQSTIELHLDVRCRSILQRIVYDASETNGIDLDFLKNVRTVIEAFKEEIVSGKDKQGRTALHLFAISFYTRGYGNDKRDTGYCIKVDLSKTIVNELISLGCNVNETDIFGRTPLHYANNILKDVLISYGADESIKDTDGNIAIDEASHQFPTKIYSIFEAITDRNDETYLLRLMNNKHIQINVQRADTQHRTSNHGGDKAPKNSKRISEFWQREVNLKTAPRVLWEEGDYAFRHPLVEQISKEVIDLIDAIAQEIERLDPRFEIRVEFVGGSNEGTKVDEPDEFDFCFVLTKLGELCEVSQSPELPTGFVRLKRRSTNAGETKQIDFEGVFWEDGILNTEKLKRQFSAILYNALVNVENQQTFEWNFDLFRLNVYALEKVLNIQMFKPLNSTSINRISIDVVPCIHVDGWWPDEAIPNVSDKNKTFGCNLVFENPQKLYPWVPYSESCARISFAKAESDIIKQGCVNAREAYMIGKTMVEKSCLNSKYVLKNCLLYCIEALPPTSENASQLGMSIEALESKFHQLDRYFWLKCLMKCHLEFAFNNISPCYFMSNFSLPFLKNNHEGYIIHKHLKNAYVFYRCASNDTSETCYQSPAPNPLWKRFDRNKWMTTLFEIAYK